jgi:hypothetical protein
MDFVLSHPGMSASAAMAMLLDESLRMHEHPGIFFQDGPAGRRAKVMDGPDVWEVIQLVKWTVADREFAAVPDLIHEVSEAFGMSERVLRIALDYYAAYPDEINARIEANERASRDQERAQGNLRALLKT